MAGSALKLEAHVIERDEVSSPSVLYQSLADYHFAELEDKMLWNDAVASPEEFAAVFEELKKFLCLSACGGSAVGMISKQVDEVWHQFILFTREYNAFCNRFFGRFIHHTPDTRIAPIPKGGVVAFLRAYEQNFGDLHPIWGADRFCKHVHLVAGADTDASCEGETCSACNNCMGCQMMGCMGCG